MLTNLEQFKPADFQHQVNTLKDMEQILHQYRDGLLTEAETLLAVQMTRAQVHAAHVPLTARGIPTRFAGGLGSRT